MPQVKNSPQKAPNKVTVKGQIPAEFLPVLEILTKRAGVTVDDIIETSIHYWLGMNADLLKESEKKRFKELIP